MTKFLCFIAACLAAASTARALPDDIEFGRSALPLVLKRGELQSKATVHGRFRRKGKRLSQTDAFNPDELELSELDRELLYMSMSMSFDHPATPSTPSVSAPSMPSSPTSPSGTSSPSGSTPTSTTPTVFSPSSLVTPSPTFQTTPSVAPSFQGATPSASTVDPTDTEAPSFTDSPFTSSPTPLPQNLVPSITPTTVFDLDETNGVVIVEPPHGNTTVVRLEIEYLVEASVGPAGFASDLDWLILKTAIVSSLEGNNSGVLDQATPSSRLSSSFLRFCNATLEEADCYIMEADIVFILNGTRDTDMAAYLAYLGLNNEMGSFDEGLDDVSRVEYLAPQPVLPTNPNPIGPDTLIPPRNGTTTRNVTAGLAAGSSVFGLLAIALYWNRKRSQNRHVQLLEDVSVAQSCAPRETATIEVVSHPI